MDTSLVSVDRPVGFCGSRQNETYQATTAPLCHPRQTKTMLTGGRIARIGWKDRYGRTLGACGRPPARSAPFLMREKV
jgi:hypothetical protein